MGAWATFIQFWHILDYNCFRVAVALLLGFIVCEPHLCICGSTVETNDYHGLSCKRSSDRSLRLRALNNIVRRALISANVSCTFQPPGLRRSNDTPTESNSRNPQSRSEVVRKRLTGARGARLDAAKFAFHSTKRPGRTSAVSFRRRFDLILCVLVVFKNIAPFALEPRSGRLRRSVGVHQGLHMRNKISGDKLPRLACRLSAAVPGRGCNLRTCTGVIASSRAPPAPPPTPPRSKHSRHLCFETINISENYAEASGRTGQFVRGSRDRPLIDTGRRFENNTENMATRRTSADIVVEMTTAPGPAAARRRPLPLAHCADISYYTITISCYCSGV
ncbi:hypothetical protein EVAR_68441_1 [Eumeta japonica]|uniref:Uncharacterized protein n=1 Tax=Eumeta variegata TaxID=151549 RepID=A0A4C1ZZH8_EUMVA|nr:hypothetical protein EVAR_68441_1 [Eumeta japonica]